MNSEVKPGSFLGEMLMEREGLTHSEVVQCFKAGYLKK